jgi:predicted nucleic acid-binding Zn ribbon protein
MSDDKLTATCTKCNVALTVTDRADDDAPVTCPVCKTNFGSWGDVKVKLKGLLAERFKDTPWITVT